MNGAALFLPNRAGWTASLIWDILISETVQTLFCKGFDMDFVSSFIATFIPLMVALDAPGTLPLYVGMTEGVKKTERRRIVRQSILTAFLVTVGFILLGRAIFNALGILVEDFMIAGGGVLLIIAIADIVRAGERKIERTPEFGVVPLGTPLIAGPGTLTTALVLVGTNGYAPVILSLIVNLLITWIIFAQSERIIKVIGISGSRAFAKVAMLILAAFAVKMIRIGIFKYISG
jgi:multiple antibiotic resistance protein